MLEKLRNQIMALVTASQAGWIVGRCKTGCIADDETETIIPCFLHEARIVELGAKNAMYNNEEQ